MLGHAVRRVVTVGVDGQEQDALWGIALGHFGEARQVGIVDRALGAEEEDNDGLPVLASLREWVLPLVSEREKAPTL